MYSKGLNPYTYKDVLTGKDHSRQPPSRTYHIMPSCEFCGGQIGEASDTYEQPDLKVNLVIEVKNRRQ